MFVRIHVLDVSSCTPNIHRPEPHHSHGQLKRQPNKPKQDSNNNATQHALSSSTHTPNRHHQVSVHLSPHPCSDLHPTAIPSNPIQPPIPIVRRHFQLEWRPLVQLPCLTSLSWRPSCVVAFANALGLSATCVGRRRGRRLDSSWFVVGKMVRCRRTSCERGRGPQVQALAI